MCTGRIHLAVSTCPCGCPSMSRSIFLYHPLGEDRLLPLRHDHCAGHRSSGRTSSTTALQRDVTHVIFRRRLFTLGVRREGNDDVSKGRWQGACGCRENGSGRASEDVDDRGRKGMQMTARGAPGTAWDARGAPRGPPRPTSSSRSLSRSAPSTTPSCCWATSSRWTGAATSGLKRAQLASNSVTWDLGVQGGRSDGVYSARARDARIVCHILELIMYV